MDSGSCSSSVIPGVMNLNVWLRTLTSAMVCSILRHVARDAFAAARCRARDACAPRCWRRAGRSASSAVARQAEIARPA